MFSSAPYQDWSTSTAPSNGRRCVCFAGVHFVSDSPAVETLWRRLCSSASPDVRLFSNARVVEVLKIARSDSAFSVDFSLGSRVSIRRKLIPTRKEEEDARGRHRSCSLRYDAEFGGWHLCCVALEWDGCTLDVAIPRVEQRSQMFLRVTETVGTSTHPELVDTDIRLRGEWRAIIGGEYPGFPEMTVTTKIPQSARL